MKKVYKVVICAVLVLVICFGTVQIARPEAFVHCKLNDYEVMDIDKKYAEIWHVDNYQNKKEVVFSIDITNYSIFHFAVYTVGGGGVSGNFCGDIECGEVWPFRDLTMSYFFFVDKDVTDDEIEKMLKNARVNICKSNSEKLIKKDIN